MRKGDILSREKDTGETNYVHEILVKGNGYQVCRERVLAFFNTYQLVRYSHIDTVEKKSLPASSPEFEDRLQRAVLRNRRILNDLTRELQEENVLTLDDLRVMPQGYKSKMLHVITHLLDGFFGIDTCFYNLEEDSHWVSDEFRQKVKALPSHYWLLYIEAAV